MRCTHRLLPNGLELLRVEPACSVYDHPVAVSRFDAATGSPPPLAVFHSRRHSTVVQPQGPAVAHLGILHSGRDLADLAESSIRERGRRGREQTRQCTLDFGWRVVQPRRSADRRAEYRDVPPCLQRGTQWSGTGYTTGDANCGASSVCSRQFIWSDKGQSSCAS